MKKYENLIRHSLIWLCLCSSLPLYSQPESYSPEQLTTLAQQWLDAQLASDTTTVYQTDISSLDPRIGSKHCEQALDFSLSQLLTQRQNTIVIRCSDTTAWQLYAPVRIDEIVATLVLRQNISTGSMITADMLETTSRARRFVRGNLVADANAVIGAKTKRSLSMGQILTFQDLCLVCKGDVVTIAIRDNGLDVSASGIAMSDGSLGDVIPIQNRQSKRTVKAEVVAVNRVSITF
ncbi:flagellar basal body P-ring formation protein FlgA [Rheinheimera muenzenbergensis]|uniref:Flagella basal body P-ring formation protein FlgA n=1 Tax=Rheinheimera muenzenbergensis TaxID=1193628 RepID=A0ABU8C215_9GAMM